MPKRIRTIIQKLHAWLDDLTGRVLAPRTRLDYLTTTSVDKTPINEQTIQYYTYSQHYQFLHFTCPPVHLSKYAYLSDLKVYQDLLTYTFIIQNFKPGARLLEIGGGNSRIIEALSSQYEFWNLDKFEGHGHGPTTPKCTHGFRQVYDFIGTYNRDLPDQYFDGVYSISTLEHVPADTIIQANILKDINRILRPGGWSFHCIDLLLGQQGYNRSNGIIEYFYQHQPMINPQASINEIRNNPDLYTLSSYQYYTRWLLLTRIIPLKRFGYPFSYNLLWRKSGGK